MIVGWGEWVVSWGKSWEGGNIFRVSEESGMRRG